MIFYLFCDLFVAAGWDISVLSLWNNLFQGSDKPLIFQHSCNFLSQRLDALSLSHFPLPLSLSLPLPFSFYLSFHLRTFSLYFSFPLLLWVHLFTCVSASLPVSSISLFLCVSLFLCFFYLSLYTISLSSVTPYLSLYTISLSLCNSLSLSLYYLSFSL